MPTAHASSVAEVALDAGALRAACLPLQLDEQYRRIPLSQAVAVLNAGLIGLVLAPVAGPRLWAWVGAAAATALLRLAIWRARARRPGRLAPVGWARLHVGTLALSGLAWGLLPVLSSPSLGVAGHMFVAAVMAGMVAGAASTTLGFSAAFAAYAVPALAPLLWILLRSPGRLELTMGAMGLGFAASLGLLARAAGRTRVASLVEQLRNQALLERLRAAAAEIQAVNAGLEQAVRGRTAELVELERRLADSALLASVGNLAAAVAHDLNNPLASLLACLHVIEAELAGAPASPELREALADALDSAGRVRAFARALGDASRHDSVRAPLDLRELVEACLRAATPELQGVPVVREHGTPCRVLSEPTSLSRVLVGVILHVGRAVPRGDPPAHELHLATRVAPGARAEVEVAVWPAPPGSSGELAMGDALMLSLSQASVARLGGDLSRRPGGDGFLLRLPLAEE